ncbi:MAG: EAL domain-containing protein [Actinobacteria bacterium]|nr:EAL domain-containing protein [Actinomycetota bacterium]
MVTAAGLLSACIGVATGAVGVIIAGVAACAGALGVIVTRRRRQVDADVVAYLDAWVSEIDPGTATERIAGPALEMARELTGARRAELVLFREGVGWHLRHRDEQRDDGWHPLSEPLALAGFHANLADGAIGLHLGRRRRGERDEHARVRAELLDGTSGPVLIVPVHGSHARGTLLVADPVGPTLLAGVAGRWSNARFLRRGAATFPPAAQARLQLLSAQLGGQLDASLLAEQVRNATDRKLRTATTDVLTGLPNRAVFVERVDDAASLSSPALLMAVLLVNLDRFREINATFGHQVGDHLLKQFGMRLRDSLPVTATVARLGGDEFAVLLCELHDQESASVMAADLLDEVTRPYDVGDASLQLDASMGVALAPIHADDATRLLQRADIAMDAAKSARSGVEIYDPGRGTDDSRQLRVLADLRRAMDADELTLVYQPKAALRSHTVRGVEALLRWNHETRGRISPGEFIPIAERTGLIHPLTRWVLRRVLEQQRLWLAAGIELEVAVNLSARNLLDRSLPGEIAALLSEHQVPSRLLRLEITESSIIVDPGRAEAVLADLHRLGISLSVDDFGTGYSSLAHLLRLPVDEIKVDRSFVAGLLVRRSEAAIVRATVDLGRRLAMTVTAEGVEDCETWDKLAELGCDLGQGFWFARPMDVPALERWLVGRRTAVIDAPADTSPPERQVPSAAS